MDRALHIRNGWRAEQGSSVAQAAAVALVAAALIAALLGISGGLSAGTSRSFRCLVASIGGGGGCAATDGSPNTVGGTSSTSSTSAASSESADEPPWWERAGGWLKDQWDDIKDVFTDPAVWVGIGVGVGVALLILAAPVSVPLLAVLAIAGAAGAAAGTLFGNWQHGQPLADNLLRNTLFGAGGGLLAAAFGEGLLAITVGGMALNSLNNVLNGQRWDKGLLASGLLAFILAWGGGKVMARPEEPITRPGVEEPAPLVPRLCVAVGAPFRKAPGLSAPLRSACITPSGAVDPAAQPRGTPTRINPADDVPTRIGLTRENEAAQTLARAGYDVEQNPAVAGAKNPDYLIEGEVFDCYSPTTSNARNIASVIEADKVNTGQTQRIVLNLDGSNVSIEALRQ